MRRGEKRGERVVDVIQGSRPLPLRLIENVCDRISRPASSAFPQPTSSEQGVEIVTAKSDCCRGRGH